MVLVICLAYKYMMWRDMSWMSVAHLNRPPKNIRFYVVLEILQNVMSTPLNRVNSVEFYLFRSNAIGSLLNSIDFYVY